MTETERAVSGRGGLGSARWFWRRAAFYAWYVVALLAGVAALLAGSRVELTAIPGMVVYDLLGIGFAARAWRSRDLGRRTRRAWGVVMVAAVLLLATPILYGIFGVVRFPGPGDVARLIFMMVLLIGLLTFPVHPASRNDRRKTALDAATVVAGGFMVLWYLVIGPAVASSTISVGVAASAVVYPLVDLVLIFGIAIVLLRGQDPSSRRPLTMLAAAGTLLIVGDVYGGHQLAIGQPITKINSWPLLYILTAHFLIAAAAFEQCRAAGAGSTDAVRTRRVHAVSKLPYAAVGTGYSLMLAAAAVEHKLYPWSGLVLGCFVITALVVTRQALVQRESHQMAVTDGLTGLANRSQLYEVLTRALARGRRLGQTSAVLSADLNGFKQVNDTMGHKAGDQLLVAFATILDRGVLGSDLVARLGGDEFAVVLNDIGSVGNAEAVVRRMIAEMRKPVLLDGVRVRIEASFGIAVCAPGEVEAADLAELEGRSDEVRRRLVELGFESWSSAAYTGYGAGESANAYG